MTPTIAKEAAMERVATRRIPPVVKTVGVRWPRAEAFDRFTSGIARWWPLPTHSVGKARARSVVFEDQVGGRIYEVDEGGETHTWGTILDWDRPTRVRFTWHPGRTPDTAQEVEVRFEDAPKGSRLVLTHTGWEALGRDAAKARFGYNIGWIPVLDRWASRTTVAGSLVNGTAAVVAFLTRLFRRKPAS